MAAAKTRPFRIGAGATCTDGVCGRATRGVRGLGAVDAAGTRPGPGRAFRWSLTATWWPGLADAAASTPPAAAAPIVETPAAGLTSAQVAERRSRGLANAGGERTSRSVAEILRANILTRFNFILGALLAVILVFGQLQDALFGIVLVTNALIGIAQELRAKRTLDRLAVLSAPRVRVIRDGAPHEIAVADLVAGDLVDLRAGDQLVADGVVRASTSMEADESLLTGESEPVGKRAGDRLLSGSFMVAGSGGYQATGVGADAYARKLAAQARRYAPVRSELMDGINQILRYVTWAIGPVAVLLVISGWHAHGNVRQVATGTVAALVGMVRRGRACGYGQRPPARPVHRLRFPAVQGQAQAVSLPGVRRGGRGRLSRTQPTWEHQCASDPVQLPAHSDTTGGMTTL